MGLRPGLGLGQGTGLRQIFYQAIFVPFLIPLKVHCIVFLVCPVPVPSPSPTPTVSLKTSTDIKLVLVPLRLKFRLNKP